MNPEEQLLWGIFSNQNREKTMDIKKARRKTFDVEYVVVTEENFDEVVKWGEFAVGGEGDGRFIKVTDKNAMNARQTRAFLNDYVLKYNNTYKAYSKKAFEKAFDVVFAPGENVTFINQDDVLEFEVTRSAETGQFVAHEEAEKNPETTVTETIIKQKSSVPTEDLGSL